MRLLALGEAALGLAAVLVGGRLTALLVAGSYAAFTAFVLLARARGGVLASCGCFGRADTPPTTTHVVVTAVPRGARRRDRRRAPRRAPRRARGGARAPACRSCSPWRTVAVLLHGVLALLPGLRVAR